MPESDELAVDIKEIRWRQKSMDSSMDLLLKANREAIMNEVAAFFGSSKRRADVYLAVDGKRAVRDIAASLGMKGPNVSIELTRLSDEGLIEREASPSGEVAWKKKRIDKVLRISEFLRKKFSL